MKQNRVNPKDLKIKEFKQLVRGKPLLLVLEDNKNHYVFSYPLVINHFFYNTLKLRQRDVRFNSSDIKGFIRVKLLEMNKDLELFYNRAFSAKYGVKVNIVLASRLIPKEKPKKPMKFKSNKSKTNAIIYRSEGHKTLEEKPLEFGVLLVVIAFLLYFFFSVLGGK